MLRSLWGRTLWKPVHLPPNIRAAYFRSTILVCAKWKSKFPPKEERGQRTPKNYVRYVVRQKRADAKRALKDLLNGRSSNPFSYEEATTWHTEVKDDPGNPTETNKQAQSRTRRQPRRSRNNGCRKNKRSLYPDLDDDEDDDPRASPVFHARFGSRCYTWSFRTSNGADSRNPFPGFQWKDETDDDETRDWKRESDLDEDDDDEHDHDGKESKAVLGFWAQRATLGLPATGPLKIGDVKRAFRLAALKWHPDRHQGPSQSAAEEKFKRCLDAYKSLCEALTSA